jgi:hypothetical protein
LHVIGFIGASGTGKSHRSTWVAKEKGAELIIDDGLLIKGNSIIAGKSAKKEGTKIASIRRALFYDEKHTKEVKAAIKSSRANSILILGTSQDMVKAIAEKLDVGDIDEKIFIQDVASDYEINQAISTRRRQGKHVIPVPTFELKKDFSGYFLDPLQIFKRKGKGDFQLEGEKSVVRPTFSYMGNYTISDYTIFQIIEFVVSTIAGVSKISRFRAEKTGDGVIIDMDLVLIYGHVIRDVLKEVQVNVTKEIESLTALNINTINLVAKSIVLG